MDGMPSRGTRTSHGNVIRFNKAKSKVLHLDWGNPLYESMLGDEQIKSSPAEKDLGVLVDERLDKTQPFAPTAQKAKHVLGCIQSPVCSRAREGILPLCSALLRAHLEHCSSSGGPAQQRHGPVGESPVKDHKDDQRHGTALLMRTG
ncbi:hypothetical protein HGM15179_014039 [Zosterops borbonicus]|uniref:Uncharacterized protein n=1 Tax=Zosterops borbonicus TaxID=364589 RepID=A0A8K1G7X9_9PASS|nr:hypothetical protein HGM15179_014039 [Zosterops borbonicus]